MDENKIEEIVDETINEEVVDDATIMTDDALKDAISAEMKKVQMGALLRGSQAICGVVLQYILEFNSMPGKHSLNDYKRLVKKITEFCSKSLGKTIDENGEIVDVKKEEATE